VANQRQRREVEPLHCAPLALASPMSTYTRFNAGFAWMKKSKFNTLVSISITLYIPCQ
jgi:hypothetical protein